MTDKNPNLEAFRAEMAEATAHCTYLDHAAISPLARRVRQAMTHYVERRGVTFGALDEFMTLPDRLRETIARLINAEPAEISFVQNTSHGLNIAAQSLPLRSGDNVIFCNIEFPSNVYPWMLLERQRGVEARCIPHDGGGLTVEALEAHADERTRVVTVSSVQFLTGFRTDLERIGEWCHQRGIYFVVDAIQSAGAAPLDVRACHADFVACGAPKWLMGPVGIGFLYCRRELLEQVTPPMAGCISVEGWQDWLDYDLTFLPTAARFELGGGNYVGMAGMLAAVEMLMEMEVAQTQRWTLHLTDRLIADLQRRGYHIISNLEPARRSAIVTFAVPGDVVEAHRRLQEAGVAISLRASYLRVSPHGYNTEEEIDRVGQVLGDAQV